MSLLLTSDIEEDYLAEKIADDLDHSSFGDLLQIVLGRLSNTKQKQKYNAFLDEIQYVAENYKFMK